MDWVVPWTALVEFIAPYALKARTDAPHFALETMLRIHCMQQWFTLSDLAMEEAFLTPQSSGSLQALRPMGECPAIASS